ncbi:MAG: hypothetical protein AAF672_09215 [Pseudomonadota bacterium]
MGRWAVWGALACGALLLLGAPVAAQSQDPPAGTVLRLDISQSLRFHDNLGLDPTTLGSTLRADTGLSLSFESETRTQSFAMILGGTFRAEDAPITGNSTDFVNPNAALSYTQEGAQARFSFDGSFAQSDLDGLLAVFDPDLGTPSLVSDNGTRSQYSLASRLDLGLSGPLGLRLEAQSRGTFYEDTLDPDLFDRRTHSGAVTATLGFSPVTEGTVRLSFTRYEAEDAARTERDTLELSFGIAHDLASGAVLEASLGGRHIDDSVTGERSAGEGRLRWSQERPDGEISAEFSSRLTTAGQVDRLSVERRLAFPNWVITGSLGVVNVGGITTEPVFALAYSTTFWRGEIGASFSSDVNISSQTEVSRVLQGSVSYNYLVGQASLLRFGLSVTDVQDAGSTGVAAVRRGSVDISFQHELAQDWTLTAGVSWRMREEAGTRAHDNAVFVTLDRGLIFSR